MCVLTQHSFPLCCHVDTHHVSGFGIFCISDFQRRPGQPVFFFPLSRWSKGDLGSHD